MQVSMEKNITPLTFTAVIQSKNNNLKMAKLIHGVEKWILLMWGMNEYTNSNMKETNILLCTHLYL